MLKQINVRNIIIIFDVKKRYECNNVNLPLEWGFEPVVVKGTRNFKFHKLKNVFEVSIEVTEQDIE